MKEKDIVDFDKMDKNPETGSFVDGDGKDIGCEICYTHEKIYEKLGAKQFRPRGSSVTREFENIEIFHPLCPECGEPLEPGAPHGYAPSGYVSVTEQNVPVPEGEASLCQVWYCPNEECPSEKHGYLFAMMPVPIEWNANHDIHITGGKHYLLTQEDIDFAASVFEKIKPSIQQYIRRKLNPKDDVDKRLNENKVLLWCRQDVDAAFATWLYEHGMKK